MEFEQLLNKYIEDLDCTVNELSEASSLSASAVSRYKSGKRIPQSNSEHLHKLAGGIVTIAHEKGLAITYTEIIAQLSAALDSKDKEYEIFLNNFNKITDVLSVNMKDLSAYTNFDLSYMYKIKSGQRKPNDLSAFVNSVSSFLITNYADSDKLQNICGINSTDTTELSEASVKSWLYENTDETNGNSNELAKDFLKELNDFNLEEYMQMIHFDDLKIPTVPFRLPINKKYYGIDDMKQGEIDFFKTTATSKAKDTLYMYSNMPMADMAEDIEFNRKWMFGIAASIKKGLTLNVIHDVNRPLNEMFLGMTAWIPIYMTGQVNGFYMKDYEPTLFNHIQFVSGACALYGECIVDHHEDGMYYLTSSKDEIGYYKNRFKLLLDKASPLMEIYTEANKEKLASFKSQALENEVKKLEESPFDNIDVSILPGEWVMIEKKKSPEITFVIKHDKMVSAFEQYIIPEVIK